MTEVTLNPSQGAVAPIATKDSLAADAAAKTAADAAAKTAAVAEAVKTPAPAGGTEAPKTEAPKLTQEQEQERVRFAQLARKERELVQRQRAMRIEADRMRQEAVVTQRARSFMSQIKSKPLEALKQVGVSYDDLTQAVLNDGKPAADMQVKALQDELRRFQAQQRIQQQRAVAAERQAVVREQRAAIQEFNEEVSEFVTANPETYELTNLHNGHGLVAQTIEAYFQKTGKVMSPKEAADQVESYLEQAVERSIATKKWAARNQKPKEEKQDVGQQQRRTLSNDMTASTPSMMNAPRTEKERIERAKAALDRHS